jgi:Transposase and inactivated derivatives
MATLRGWAPCGTRLTAKVPHGHWKTTTFLAALRYDRIEAPWVLDGPIDGESFTIYVEKVLLPTLKPGDIVIMDNLGSHKGKAVRALIRSVGAKLFFLPKYSPDLNPIEQVFAKNTCCAEPPREPSKPSRPPSVSCSQTSPQQNAPTTSKTLDTPQLKFIPL